MTRFVCWRSGVVVAVLSVKVHISVKGWLRNMTCNGRKYRTEIAGRLVKADFEGRDSIVWHDVYYVIWDGWWWVRGSPS